MITSLLDAPFFTGGASSSLVPGVFPVALGGRPYMLDLGPQSPGAWKHETIPLVRGQTILQSQPDERSLNPEDFWRRSATSWDHGAGQNHYDLDTSDSARYRTSRGIDPWTRGEISLLPGTQQKYATSNPVQLVVAGDFCYLLDGSTLKYTTDMSGASPSFSTVTPAGTAISTPTSITTDGFHVWVSDATNVYYTIRGTATYAPYPLTPRPVSVLRYVKGRLIGAGVAGDAGTLYEFGGVGDDIVGGLPFATNLNVDFAWDDFTEGPSGIYGGGFSGDKSSIYFITIDQTSTALTAPRAVSDLPDGETIRALRGYLGNLLIGSDFGVRFAATDTSGNVTLGDLISLPPVRCFEPQDRFVWFGWTDFDVDATGLGRLDLRTLNQTTPAYASDLMANTLGTVSSVVTFQDVRLFTVDGQGVWGETTALVSSGRIDSGLVGYGLTDVKTAAYLEVASLAGVGSFQASLAAGGTTNFVNVGGNVATGESSSSVSLSAAQQVSEFFEVRLILTRDNSDLSGTVGPVVARWTLRADPHAPRRVQITAPLLLAETITDNSGMEHHFVCDAERAQIRSWVESRQPITWQEGKALYSVIAEDYQWVPHHGGDDPPVYDIAGTMVVLMRTL